MDTKEAIKMQIQTDGEQHSKELAFKDSKLEVY